MTHHNLDPYPIPKDKLPLYINEPWLIDKSLSESHPRIELDKEDDNVRIYIPMDLNKDAILRRLDRIIADFGEANEDNESEFRLAVDMLIYQIEIYDQVWYVRHVPGIGEHSNEAKILVKEFVGRLAEIPDGCAECFPYETIDELRHEYLSLEE